MASRSSLVAAAGPGVAEDRIRGYRPVVLTGFAYALLVLIMWGAFNPHSGLPYETAFPYASETTSRLDGFLYRADPLRIHSSTFYHLSYLIGEALGIGGSYVPFQAVYAVLWWARGFLVFLILRKFLPSDILICYSAGALVLVHASDGALQWVGQLNQFGVIFWMLLAFYLLTLSFEMADMYLAALLAVAACFFEYMSLWSYESQLLLLLVFPLVLLLHPVRGKLKLASISALWYSVPAVYLARTLQKYAHSGGATYQQSVMRKNWGLGSLVSDWSFNIVAGLNFWKWTRGGWRTPESQAILLSSLAALLFVSAAVVVIRCGRASHRRSVFVGTAGTYWVLLTAGFVLLALSFPAYLLLDSARGLWRTQFLSGIGAGLVLTALMALASRVFSRSILQATTFLILGCTIVFCGSLSAIQKGGFHRWIWERHRTAIVEILRIAPSVKPDTVIVLANVPKDNDPFGHNMWLDLALRLAYPGIPVAGVYFYANGTPSPGNNLKAEGDRWKWDGTGLPPLVHETSISNTVIVDLEPSGIGQLEKTMSPFVCRGRCAVGLYNPTSVITGPISARTVRRYRLEPPF